MVQASPIHCSGTRTRPCAGKRLAFCPFAAVAMIVTVCSKQVSRASQKLLKSSKSHASPEPSKFPAAKSSTKGEFGDGGVWQKDIMLGGKCQPHDFSGVIYYDSNGKQVSDFPMRSPRASPLPGYKTRDMF